MDKLEQLGKLQSLRASGALSEEEFEHEKQALLQPSGCKVFWILAAVIAFFLLVFAALQIGKSTRTDQVARPASTVVSKESATSPGTLEPQAISPVVASSKLGQLFATDLIGSRLAYFESIAGPPHDIISNTRNYVVDGCQVDVTVKSGEIESVGLDVDKRCSFDVGSLFGAGLGQANQLTFGKTRQAGGGDFTADCLSMCGNAADPVVSYGTGGYHAVQFRWLIISVPLVGNDALAASKNWTEAMKPEGEDYIRQTQFNCDGKYERVAETAFAKVRPSHVEVFASAPKRDGCEDTD